MRNGIIAIQKKKRLTDEAMAKKLGIHPKSWSRIKNGHSNPSDAVKKAAVRQWPELLSDYIKEIYEKF